MEVSKIRLSATEAELMQNAEIILTKNRVLEKIKNLLEEVQDQQMAFVNTHLKNHEAFLVSPKISRGENYMGLPWLILDYPRMSSASNLFFIRSMFWWGRFFSSTLHISGTYKKEFSGRIKNELAQLPGHFAGINEDPWIHHFEPDNYQSIKMLSKNDFERMESLEHLKIGITFPLHDWQQAAEKLFDNWKLYLQITGLVANAV